jgi:hypothetical protein
MILQNRGWLTRMVGPLLVCLFALQSYVSVPAAQWGDPAHTPAPPANALGFPNSNESLALEDGFRTPPPGYGQVPFWWWTGDPLDKERLLWQIKELHRKGVSGMQVNYAHEDTPGWPTYDMEPALFSEAWWEVWEFVAAECAKRDMGIGLSGYTIDWPNGKSLVSRTIYSETEIQGREIEVIEKIRTQRDQSVTRRVPGDLIGLRAYPVTNEGIGPGSRDLSGFVKDGKLAWPGTDHICEIWMYTGRRKPGTLNPMHPLAGQRVIEKFFQQFQDHAPGKSPAGLNYFFHDELQFGVGDRIWVDDLAEVFHERKGYDLFDALPAMFTDIGPSTPKARLDFMDVKVQLAEERYFRPIFNWHWSRGKIYGCDQGGRGRNPLEFGDYFRSVRWYTAPGHDTPGGNADLIKGKVSSSIAHLYRRPRVWLEGYHSLGWGATPERLMRATCENYIYGCTLLNLHGLYYTTHGSFWEWAPPSYHFRMPYWDHMQAFMTYFERLSYLLSQGVHCCDVAIMYPVAPLQADMQGKAATRTAFDAGKQLMDAGIDFDFMDFQSLDRAQLRKRKLEVSGERYRVLVLPAMRAIRWSTLLKAQAFYRAGGMLIALGALPEASDRAGRNDPLLDAAVKELFGVSGAELRAGAKAVLQRNRAGGIAMAASKDLSELMHLLPRDVKSESPIKALHRRMGARDVYMVMGAAAGSKCVFRARGQVELWDPWTGTQAPLTEVSLTEEGTGVRMPLQDYEAQVIVFSPAETTLPDKATIKSASTPLPESLALEGPWEFELKPTMDNQWGDFRLPATDRMIGPEARIFGYAESNGQGADLQHAERADIQWQNVTYGFGQRFWKLGPLPRDIDRAELEGRLAAMQQVDPSVPVEVNDKAYHWTSYAFSWRWGLQGDPGHQGYHGLKENISNDFICLGKAKRGLNETLYVAESAGTRYYLWTCALAKEAIQARVMSGGLTPARVYIKGVKPDRQDLVTLSAGANPMLLCYDQAGRGHFVLERIGASEPDTRTALSMLWNDRPGLVPFDVRPHESNPMGWYRFTAPPGFKSMRVNVRGRIQAWADGRPLSVTEEPGLSRTVRQYRLDVPQPLRGKAEMVLCIEQQRGFYGGAALPEPIKLDCAPGLMAVGDWSQGSALACYSGGAWYRKTVTLTAEQVRARVLLNLGDVVATAELHVNGRKVGIRVAPPWTWDMSEFVRAGENRIEILVYNTLANHYLTVPTRYRGALKSGLLGPVRLEFQVPGT